MNNRILSQISEEMRRVISDIVQNKIKDPRIPEIISISHTEVTRDLSYAKVYVQIMGDEKIKEDAIEGLNSAKGFIKKEISKSLKLRAMPDLIFINDESLDINMKMEELIKEVNHGQVQ